MLPLEVKLDCFVFLPELCLRGGGHVEMFLCSSGTASLAESWGDVPVASCVMAKLLLAGSAVRVLLLFRNILKVQTRVNISSACVCSRCGLFVLSSGGESLPWKSIMS